jgi:transcriptional regulator with XRE-family HTH domain
VRFPEANPLRHGLLRRSGVLLANEALKVIYAFKTSRPTTAAVAVRLDQIQKCADVSAREVADLLNTTPETVSRWRTGRTEPQPERRDSLLRLEWLVKELSELYPPKEAHLWLYSPHKRLAGQRPADLIQAGKTEDVLRIIAQLKDGAFV